MSNKVWLKVKLMMCPDTHYGEYPIVMGIYNEKPDLGRHQRTGPGQRWGGCDDDRLVVVEMEIGKEFDLYDALLKEGVYIEGISNL